MRVTDYAFSLAFLAQPTDGDAWLFAAHYEIGVMFRHLYYKCLRSDIFYTKEKYQVSWKISI